MAEEGKDYEIIIEQTKTLDSLAVIGQIAHLNSDAYILNTSEQTINSDAWILKSGNEKTINSDAWIQSKHHGEEEIFVFRKEINSDAWILKSGNEETINSDAWITGIQRITSDAYIKKIDSEETINSDAYILQTYEITITSDACIMLAPAPDQSITSDAFIIMDGKTVYGGVAAHCGTIASVATLIDCQGVPWSKCHLWWNGARNDICVLWKFL